MPTSDPRVDAVFAEAAGVAHPRDSQLRLLRNRVSALERQVAYLARRVDVLVDLLPENGEAE